jgi:mercuric reductase
MQLFGKRSEMADRQHVTLRIEGMTCDGCARHVQAALASVPGVESAEVGDWKEGSAAVATGPDVSEGDLSSAVERAGYRAIVESKTALRPEARVPTGHDSEFDLVVIGGGSAAFAAAIKGTELGARVAVVEQGTIGGTCVNVGCVPSKTLIKAAEICYHTAYSNFKGFDTCPPPREWQTVVRQKDELVEYLRKEKYENVLKAHPAVKLIRGHAELLGPREVQVDGKRYRPGKIIVATGSSNFAPPIPGLKEVGFLDSTTALRLPALPQSMIVIGGGSIGLELGQLFQRFGVRVTLLEVMERIAAAEEPEISDALKKYLSEERMRVLTGVKIERVERSGNEYRVQIQLAGKPETLIAEQLLVSTGRRANTNGFGLEKAGVELGRKDEIKVDRHLQTTNQDIYAAGDVTGDPMFVYVAAYAGSLAAENALNGAGKVYDLSALPRVTFTDPQIASVGATEQQARGAGIDVETAVLRAEYIPRAQASRNLKGLIKLVRERGTMRLVGAHVLTSEGGEVIQEATLAIRFKLTTEDIVKTYHPYLTMVEGLKLAALTFSKNVEQLSCCAA